MDIEFVSQISHIAQGHSCNQCILTWYYTSSSFMAHSIASFICIQGLELQVFLSHSI